ncbi:PLP-dependent aminotransferase family protein [Cytophagaceae bacterium DM2B3-1]|uniref:PLP-dependent aminotransferase family protein n=1 Tax=Xanthocytophaga flava TaxID=3048013 RepID=A0ABT7CWQ9_9BACT|nr:PLP-dependent aminotransferase family protein [Xanthocytophaga flavus]MDJ1497961.1 PLP-dependent aminotransferase family protein [Xanthocytophaga flavus]
MANYLYLQIAQRIEEHIENGTYKAGEKLPSVRSIHEEQGISISTVLEAYHHLEDRGLIVAQEKSGYYVSGKRRTKEQVPSQVIPALKPESVVIDSLLETIMQERFIREVVSFSRAIPGNHLIPSKILKRNMLEVLRIDEYEVMNYTQLQGNDRLRNEIAKRSLGWGGMLTAKDICITSGCLEAIHLALRATTQQGDIVAVESPCYYGFLEAIQGLRLQVIEIPSHAHTGIDLNYLEDVYKQYPVKACIVTPNFSNPTGSLMPDSNKKELVALTTRYQVPLIEDDIYGELYFQGTRPTSLKMYDKEDWVIVCSSFSKTLAPGLRVGWVAGGRFRQSVERLKFMTNIAATTVAQLVIARLLEVGSFERHLKRMRSKLFLQMTEVQAAVEAYFPEGTSISHPQGGYVVWIELPEKVSSMELYKVALQQGIGFTPGHLFSTGMVHSHFLRLSCGSVTSEQTEQALKTLGQLAKELIANHQ